VEDIVSRGDDDAPSSSWRKRLALAVVLAAVLAFGVIEHLPHGPVHSAAGSHQHATRRPSAVVPIAVQANGPVARPAEIGAVTVRPSGRIRLPRTGQHPAWFWPGRGRTEPIGGLPASKLGYVFTRLTSGWAIQPVSSVLSSCGGCPGSPRPVYYLSNRARTVTTVAAAATMVAPGTSGIWLTSFAAGQGFGTTAGIAGEYSIAGIPEGPAVRLPVGFTIVRGTTAGLLLVSITERSPAGFYWLWDPATGRFTASLRGVIAASATQVAVTRNCAPSCVVDVVNLNGRHRTAPGSKHKQVWSAGASPQTTLELPVGDLVAEGAFSSDGRYLALAVGSGDGGESGALAARLEVASLQTGRLTIVPHISVSSDSLAGFGWPGGDRLVAELSSGDRIQMTFWVPGAHSIAVATVDPDSDPGDLVIG
jgi:hypothetical protein